MLKWLQDWFGIAKPATATPKPNFQNGFQVNGTDYTATELNNALNAGSGVEFSAGGFVASKVPIMSASNNCTGGNILGSKQFQVQSPTASKGSVFISKQDDATDLTSGIQIRTQAGARNFLIPDLSTKASSDTVYLAILRIENTTTSIPGGLGCLLYNTGDNKLYVCTTASATAATWTLVGSQS